RKRDVRWALRCLVITIYVWGGIQKANVTFIDHVFPTFIAPASRYLPRIVEVTLAYSAPLFETALGIGLAIRQTRRVTVVVAVAFHIALLAMLTPYFLRGQEWIVLPWNLTMIAFVVVLFWPHDGEREDLLLAPRRPFQYALLLLLGVLPAASFYGYWDPYLSFAMFSGNKDAADFFIRRDALPGLPASVGRFIRGRRFNWKAWSTSELGMAVHPTREGYDTVRRF